MTLHVSRTPVVIQDFCSPPDLFSCSGKRRGTSETLHSHPAHSAADPIHFVTPVANGSADIVIDDSAVYQTIYGLGAALSG